MQTGEAQILHASTSEVYGDPQVHPQPRLLGGVNPIGVRSCYDEGKRVAETLCFDFTGRMAWIFGSSASSTPTALGC